VPSQVPEPANGQSYEPRRPERTLLYRLVSDHLETFLEQARESHDRGLPRYVERELRKYLKCGIHAYGFLRALCKSCGRSLLVAFSCKRRGVCPSCNARRMCATAAHLVDRVIPDVPLRQWVLSVPFELRLTLARRADALSAVGRIFVEEIFRWQRERAREWGIAQSRSGAVQFPQRFGGSLNLNVHYHVVVPDGVFTRLTAAEHAEFHRLGQPDPTDLADIAFNTSMRVQRWLQRKGLLADPDEVHFSNETPERAALDACLEGSIGLGDLTCLPDDADAGARAGGDEPPRPERRARRGGHHRGFDVHAGVVVAASNREGREKLFRYCARPPLSLERLSVTAEGMVAYRLRKPWNPEQTHRVMTPMQFMARLAALVPPPRHPLIRFHGVFAPHSAWRSSVVPVCPGAAQSEPTAGGSIMPDAENDLKAKRSKAPRGDGSAALTHQVNESPDDPSPSSAGPLHAARHTLAAGSGYIDWAELLKRIHDVDVLACPCGGRLRFIALVTEKETAQTILEAMGLPTEAPPIARARSPDFIDDPAPDW